MISATGKTSKFTCILQVKKGLAGVPLVAIAGRCRISKLLLTTTPEQQAVGVVDTSESTLRGELIRSPMPGMFYRSSSPDEPPFVQVGDSVSKNDTICLIEAMKIFNEVQSESDCDIIEILVENATAIEFDQPLFRIKRR